jgi:ATP-dependent DNA ligase
VTLRPPILPMLAKAQPEIPRGEGWLYEPKWDGFRAIIFIESGEVHIGSRNTQPLQRYFPELLDPLRAALPDPCVVDGEIVIATPDGLDFDALQLRIHPAASRVAMLAQQQPAQVILFDLLAVGDRDLREERFDTRRRLLVERLRPGEGIALTPQTDDAEVAAGWFTRYEGAGLDGVVAKRADQAYRADQRVMVKVKHERTADCVVGAYRVASADGLPGALLLGLYSDEGVLHYVGNTHTFSAAGRRELRDVLAPHEGGSAFGHGRAPGGLSRWNRGKQGKQTVDLAPALVCEVAYDHMQGPRFRHPASFRRWRPDRDPASCTFAQLEPPVPFDLREVLAGA